MTNLDRYKADLAALVKAGERLDLALQLHCEPEAFGALVKKQLGSKAKAFLDELPQFGATYQRWYSEATALIRQLLPDRLSDFISHYQKPKNRKDITYENYKIEDCLQGLTITRGVYKEKIVGPDAAIPQLRQQIAILKAVEARFESSLFDIRQLVQADLFDSELDAARELVKNRFARAAGAMAGVVLERHLAQVCANHAIVVTKKAPTISDLNDLLRKANVLDVPQWRFIQHLGDIRNLCDHNKAAEPTPAQVEDLVSGVEKLVKTLF